MEIDILIKNGILITMDKQRRIIEDGAIAILNDRIIEVNPTPEMEGKYNPKKVISARNMVIMPGLIDGHAHAGHGLVKNMGADQNLWENAVETIYSRGSSEEFWFVEAQLTALERLKCGTTTGVSFLGGWRQCDAGG